MDPRTRFRRELKRGAPQAAAAAGQQPDSWQGSGQRLPSTAEDEEEEEDERVNPRLT